MRYSNPFETGQFLQWISTDDPQLKGLVLALALLALSYAVRLIVRSLLRTTGGSRFPGHNGLYRRTAARPKLVSIIREPRDMADPRDQMGAIARVSFDTIPLLNREEVRLLPPLEAVTREHGRGHRLLAQTSLGELIRPSGKPSSATRAAFASIDSKQLDFALVDAGGRLAAAIEYRGSGHYHDRAFMRDAVKREALRKAGVPFVEIAEDYREEDVRRQIRQILAPESAGPSRN